MILNFFLFIIGFVLLVKGADWLVEGSASVAKRLGIPDIIVGLTLIAFGTSLPELVINVIASLNGEGDIAMGNILGSNIANILLILGIATVLIPKNKIPVVSEVISMVRPPGIHTSVRRVHIPYSALAAIILFLLSRDKIISLYDGLILIVFFALFLVCLFFLSREKEPMAEVATKDNRPLVTSMIIGGLFALYFGGKWVVNGAVAAAQWLGISEALIALTVVAIGTSLPELATSVVAARKRKYNILVGNIIGSNIFNIFWVLGLSSVIRPFRIQFDPTPDIAVIVFATALLMFLGAVYKKHPLPRWGGWMFLAGYGAYLTYVILRG